MVGLEAKLSELGGLFGSAGIGSVTTTSIDPSPR